MFVKILPVFAACLFSVLVNAPPTILIKASRLYDSEKNIFLENQQVLVEGNKIKATGSRLDAPAGAIVLDLPDATIDPD